MRAFPRHDDRSASACPRLPTCELQIKCGLVGHTIICKYVKVLAHTDCVYDVHVPVMAQKDGLKRLKVFPTVESVVAVVERKLDFG